MRRLYVDSVSSALCIESAHIARAGMTTRSRCMSESGCARNAGRTMTRIITPLGMMLKEGLRLLLSQGPNSLARIGVPTTSHKDVRASYVQQRSLTKGSQLSMEMSKFAHLRFQLGNDSRKRLHHHNLIFLMLHSVSVV